MTSMFVQTLFRTATAICAAAAAAGAQTTPQAPAQSPQSVMRMAERVQREILSLTEYGVFDHIRFSIQNYAVTLKGSASRPILKEAAGRVVKRIEGVEKVDNRIEVLPLSRMDDDIRARVYARVYFHPSLSRYNPNRGVPIWTSPARIAAGITNDPPAGFHPIHIIVKNGNVILEGVVQNVGDKTIAGIEANTVPGVFAVENELMVADESRPIKRKK